MLRLAAAALSCHAQIDDVWAAAVRPFNYTQVDEGKMDAELDQLRQQCHKVCLHLLDRSLLGTFGGMKLWRMVCMHVVLCACACMCARG